MNEMRKLMESISQIEEGRRLGVDYYGPVVVTQYDNNEIVLEIDGEQLSMSVGDWENFIEEIRRS